MTVNKNKTQIQIIKNILQSLAEGSLGLVNRFVNAGTGRKWSPR